MPYFSAVNEGMSEEGRTRERQTLNIGPVYAGRRKAEEASTAFSSRSNYAAIAKNK